MTGYGLTVEVGAVMPRRSIRRRTRPDSPRVGFFGILGEGNLGNDGSMDVVVAFLRDRHPEAKLSFLCMGPEQIAARHGGQASYLLWYKAHVRKATGTRAALLKIVGKLLDPFRTFAWVRRQDVVIVPGMGVLEATVPMRPWGFPYALFMLSVSGRVLGTRVALVSVGADAIDESLTRWLIMWSARFASYRSYRDAHSRDAVRRMGVDTSGDEIYPDLAFGLPTPPVDAAPTGAVGIGVMAYRGRNGDRGQADQIHATYLAALKSFVRWLVDGGRQVRLFIGDHKDDVVVQEILADLRAHRPAITPFQVVAEPATTLEGMLHQLAGVDTMVATRYHNVLCALKMCRPTVSIGYAAKHDVLMTEMGLGEFCQSARSVDVEHLIEQFTAIERRSDELRHTLAERNRVNAERLEHQFNALSTALFPAAGPAAVPTGQAPCRGPIR